MSEYQYYEFRAIDRPLGREEMDELRALSSRAEITPTSFTNEYHYGDFRGDPDALMDRYFDAFVYVANWGTRRLAFRIPRGFVDVDVLPQYHGDDDDEEQGAVTFREGKDHVVIEFLSHDEGDYEWTEGEPWMPSLISIRDELMRGDLRALYLGWLSTLSWRVLEEEDDDDEREPPVPPGLGKLSGPLRSLAEFLRVDEDLIEVAAAASTGKAAAGPSRAEMARWVEALPAADKDDYLVRFLAEEGDVALRAELARRFREATAPRKKGRAPEADGRRTVAQLLAARDALANEKARKEAEHEARERARRAKEKAEARAKHLDELAGREPALWRKVEELIATKLPKDYDRAVELLLDLRDLADRSGKAEETATQIRALRERHSRKSTLLKRFDKKGLGT